MPGYVINTTVIKVLTKMAKTVFFSGNPADRCT